MAKLSAFKCWRTALLSHRRPAAKWLTQCGVTGEARLSRNSTMRPAFAYEENHVPVFTPTTLLYRDCLFHHSDPRVLVRKAAGSGRRNDFDSSPRRLSIRRQNLAACP